MFLNAVILVLTVLSLEILARPSSVVEMTNNKKVSFNQLYISSIKFKCQPQPRAFLSESLLDVKLGSTEMLTPNSVVLHRCDKQAGCCLGHNQICTEQSSEQITIQFKVMDRFSNPTNPKFLRYVEVTQFNHTVCNCSLEHNPPKRFYEGNLESLTSIGLTNTSGPLLKFLYLFYLLHLLFL